MIEFKIKTYHRQTSERTKKELNYPKPTNPANTSVTDAIELYVR
jgi:hypothetical protein